MIEDYLLPNTPKFVLNRYKKAAENIYKKDFGDLTKNVIVLDTETTGVSFKSDRLTQIAAAKIEGGEIKEWFVTFVNPGIPIPEDIQKLTAISNEDVQSAPSEAEAISLLVKFVGDAKIVAHNADFDRHFVSRLPEGKSLKENTWFDSLSLTRIVFPRIKSHRLQDIVKQFNGPAPSHRADVDVSATVFLYNLLLSGINEMPLGLVNTIARLAKPADWPLAEIFQKVASSRSDEVSRETFSLSEDRTLKIQRSWFRRNIKSLDEVLDEAERKMVPPLAVPDDDVIIELFSDHGKIAEVFENYEKRQEQLDLALAILENFRRHGILVAEAGTGIGKSLAYCVVAAEIAKLNNVPIGISTKTNNLLDQLTNKDLPALSKIYEDGIQFAPLKGITHYPCLRKIDALVQEGGTTREYQGQQLNTAASIATILSFVEQTTHDDIDMLRMDFRALPKAFVTSTSSQCFKKKCPFYGTQCFTYGARRRAEDAEIVVTNHSLLLSDMATGGAVLPTITRWIVDEAHTFEDEARKTFVVEVDENIIKDVSEKVSSVKEATCVFSKLREKWNHKDGANLFFSLLEGCFNKGDVLTYDLLNVAVGLRSLSQFDSSPKSSYEVEEIWVSEEVKESSAYQDLKRLCAKAKESSRALSLKISDLVNFLDDYKDMGRDQAELNNLNVEVASLFEAFSILAADDEDYFESFVLTRRKSKEPFALNAKAYDAGVMLNKYLYPNIESLVYTSATLLVDKSFDTFENNLGLKPGTHIFEPEPPAEDEEIAEQFRARKTFEIALPSSYNFDANMTVFAPIDVQAPARPGSEENKKYLTDLQNLICKSTIALGGSMLILFTSRSEMEACFEACQPQLLASGLRAICQHKGSSTKRITDEFLEDESVSLFALKSFWEGFDAPGDTLRGVIVARLPFAKPTDPLYKERELREKNRNVFMEYTVPRTIIEVRQAVGRLIRKPSDKGVVILADSRVNKSNYGKKILRSMPTEDVRQVRVEEMIQTIKNIW